VVSSRQQERQWGRERERLEETQVAMETHYRAQVDALSKQLQATEREKNLFIVRKYSPHFQISSSSSIIHFTLKSLHGKKISTTL
jgi:hypothetical protein